tara:strand:+ start:327 stop:893 length:567 start_codon:yes stop_codon:yes gene_type:complete
MAGESLFRQMEIEAFRAGITPRTKQSINWFRNKARQLFRGRYARMDRKDIMNDEALSLKGRPTTAASPLGKMYMYIYDAKHKDKLPYYDAFPLVIMLGPAERGFYGLNLHYLPPVVRAKLLDAVLGSDNSSIPEKYIAPARKRYLTTQVRSRFALVEKPEWEIATFLPMADFRGASVDKVYKDSRKLL